GLATVAHDRGHGRHGDDASPAGAYHGQQERLGDIEEAVERDIDDARPLRVPHPRHHGIVEYAGVVDENLDGPGLEETTYCSLRLASVGDAEPHGFRRALLGHDGCRHLLGAFYLTVGVDINRVSRGGESLGDGGADGAAAACHECADHRLTPKRTVA